MNLENYKLLEKLRKGNDEVDLKVDNIQQIASDAGTDIITQIKNKSEMYKERYLYYEIDTITGKATRIKSDLFSNYVEDTIEYKLDKAFKKQNVIVWQVKKFSLLEKINPQYE